MPREGLSDHALEMAGLYERVSRAVGRDRNESLADAAARVMAMAKGDRRWRVASVLLGEGDGWAKLRKAAKVADRSGLW